MYSFCQRIFNILVFRIRFWRTILFRFFAKSAKMRWVYEYFGRPRWAMLGHPREHQKSKRERRAAWERFRKMQNERRAAREPVFCPHGPDWSPQKDPPKTSQTIYLKMVLKFFGAPLEHPSWAHQKMEQPKWVPKSGHSECSKCYFFHRFLTILVFCIRFWRALLFRFVFKICKKAFGFIDISDALTEAMLGHPREHQKSKNECRAL